MEEKRSYNRRVLAKRLAFVAMCLALCFFVAFATSGCKETDVLTEHIEDEENGTLDPDVEPIYKEDPNAEDDPNRNSMDISESEREDDQINNKPTYSSTAQSDETTENREQKSDSANQQNATTGDTEDDSEGDNPVSGEGEESEAESGDDGEGDDEGAEETTPNQTPVGAGQRGTAYGEGENVEPPQDVKSIATVGQYATIVQMLTGKGCLVACDKEWQEEVEERGVFPDEEVDKLTVAWTGNATEGYKVDIDALIEAKPQLVMGDGTLLTADEEERLLAAGIDTYLSFPTLGMGDTSDDTIVEGAVLAIGDMISRKIDTDYDPEGTAADYEDFHNAVIQFCHDNAGGYAAKLFAGQSSSDTYKKYQEKGEEITDDTVDPVTTVFVNSLEPENSSCTTERNFRGENSGYRDGGVLDSSDGVALSATQSNQSGFQLLDYYLQVSAIVNMAYPKLRPAEKSYPILYGQVNNDSLYEAGKYFGWSQPSALWYTPLSDSGVSESWILVGDESFPGILVRYEYIADQMKKSADKIDGLYNVGQEYFIYVVPSGIAGSWADGTVESFLLAPWAYEIFRNDGELTEEGALDCIREFYKTFYRCDYKSALDNLDTKYCAECPRSY